MSTINDIWITFVTSSTLVWAAGLWGMLLFIKKATWDSDKHLNPLKRTELYENIACITKNPELWVVNFNYLFDEFFGKKHFGLICFVKSTLISITLFTLVWFILDGTKNRLDIIEVISIAAITNVFIDYASLLETRYILSLKLLFIYKLAVDLLLTLFIAFSWSLTVSVYFSITAMSGMISAMANPIPEPGSDIESIHEPVLQEETIGFGDVINGISEFFSGLPEFIMLHNQSSLNENIFLLIIVVSVITSFSTSIWLWLHGISHLTIKSFSASNYIMGWLDIKDKPLRSIGIVINVYIMILGIIVYPAYIIFY